MWKSGGGEDEPSSTPDLLARVHPTWKALVDSCGPFTDGVEDSGSSFLRGTCLQDPPIVVTHSCATTMTAARFLALSGSLGPWGSVVAAEQVQGRGQLRRFWVSTPGNLHASMVLPEPPVDGPWREALPDLRPLVMGYVISEVLMELGANLKLKWPNDLLQDGRKIGGLLIEEVKGAVILGLGLNLVASPPDEQMREDCSAPAGVLQMPSRALTAAALWQVLVTRGKSVYEYLLDDQTPSRFLSRVANRLAWIGQTVLVREGGSGEYTAVVKGLSSNGGLVMSRGERESILYSGSIYPLRTPCF
ncbi:biotin--[acetyl-CoA-carboxylase] ligase [Pseudodesulfovibrio sp.]|uniref:biotin--[acetyl-CoA-carboxylase] ligase n=1 Tax=unclassified Pseudodesulfovibrio TaxID=2661612 RepID=UPI003AFF61BA